MVVNGSTSKCHENCFFPVIETLASALNAKDVLIYIIVNGLLRSMVVYFGIIRALNLDDFICRSMKEAFVYPSYRPFRLVLLAILPLENMIKMPKILSTPFGDGEP